MEHTGNFDFSHFPAALNPTAQEFRPTHPIFNNPSPYNSYYYPYNFYNPPPPPLPLPPPPPPPPPVYTRPNQPCLPPQLPSPSTRPTRTLLLSSVPPDVSESTIRRDLELFGDVRAVQKERIREGIVTVHFYDLRQSTDALHVIQDQHMQQQSRLRQHFDALTILSPENSLPYVTNSSFNSPPLPPPAPGLISGRAVWAQFSYPVPFRLPDGYNQGTVVVFNLDSNVSPGTLRDVFKVFGNVKELRTTPSKNTQRFVEFYDTRDAAKALVNMNGKEINGKPVGVEFSRPGGHKNCPKFNKFTQVNSVRPQSIALGARKCHPDSRVYRPPRISPPPPPPPPPPPVLSKKAGKKPMEQQPSVSGGGGGWNKQRRIRLTREKYDPRFLFKENGAISEACFSDTRTTVMIKNIPNKYSQKLLLNMLDSHCIHCNEQIYGGGDGESGGQQQPLSAYDFVYLPIDFTNKCNVGYGFVNMTSPEATWRLYKAFHHQNWEVFNSKKICEVSYARLQGLETLKEHFKNSRFPCDAEEYMPVVFTPPRDGRRLTDPTPIVGGSVTTTSSDPDDDELCLTEESSCNNSSSCHDDSVTVNIEDEEYPLYVNNPVNDDDDSNYAACSNGGGSGNSLHDLI